MVSTAIETWTDAKWDRILNNVIQWRHEFTSAIQDAMKVTQSHCSEMVKNNIWVQIDVIQDFQEEGKQILLEIQNEAAGRNLTLASLGKYKKNFESKLIRAQTMMDNCLRKLWISTKKLNSYSDFDSMFPSGKSRRFPYSHQIHHIIFELFELENPHSYTLLMYPSSINPIFP